MPTTKPPPRRRDRRRGVRLRAIGKLRHQCPSATGLLGAARNGRELPRSEETTPNIIGEPLRAPRSMAPQPNKDIDPLARHSLSAAELKQLLAVERAGEPFLAFRDEQRPARAACPSATRREPTRWGAAGRVRSTDSLGPEVSGLHAELQRAGGEWRSSTTGSRRTGLSSTAARRGSPAPARGRPHPHRADRRSPTGAGGRSDAGDDLQRGARRRRI